MKNNNWRYKLMIIVLLLICCGFRVNTNAQKISNTPERRKDIRKPADTSWNQLSAGDKMFANSQLFNPAGQSLNLAEGTRVLNLDLARQKKFLIAKNNNDLCIIDANDFKVIDHFNYEKEEAGSMYGLAVDSNDSTIYFTGAQKNLYVGNIGKSGTFTLTKKIDLSVEHKATTPLGIGLCDNILLW